MMSEEEELFLNQLPDSEGSLDLRHTNDLSITHSLGVSYHPLLAPLFARSAKDIVFLYLGGNKINDSACTTLVRSLPILKNLELLSLSNNDIGDHGACELAKAVRGNITSLTYLSVRNNCIGSSGAIALASVSVTCLQHLSLEGNKIGDNGGAAVIFSLSSKKGKRKSPWLEIHMQNCALKDKTLSALIHMIKEGYFAATQLFLSANDFNAILVADLLEVLAGGKGSLKELSLPTECEANHRKINGLRISY